MRTRGSFRIFTIEIDNFSERAGTLVSPFLHSAALVAVKLGCLHCQNLLLVTHPMIRRAGEFFRFTEIPGALSS